MAYAKVCLVLPFVLLCSKTAFAEDENLSTQLMRATVKISHEKSTGAGFVLAKGPEKYLLVTTAHVFDNTPGDETTLVFRSKQAEGDYTKEPLKLVIRKEGKTLWIRHPTEDVAVIWITPPKNADLPQISPDLIASDAQLRKCKVQPGDNLAYLGYPHGVEGNKAGFPVLRGGLIASFPLLPTAKTKTFFLSANVFEGDSGGPVYLNRPNQTDSDKVDLGLIMGLVSAQQFLDEELKMAYGTTKVRHRLGLAIIVHGSFIKETIDLLK
jgi:hypothetical protein